MKNTNLIEYEVVYACGCKEMHVRVPGQHYKKRLADALTRRCMNCLMDDLKKWHDDNKARIDAAEEKIKGRKK